MNDLKPCPFCGGEALLTEEDCYGYVSKDILVICEKCNLQFGFGSQFLCESEAITAWNNRAETVRMIDANKVVSIIKNVFTDRENGNPSFFAGLETAIELINNAPTIEPKEDNNESNR